MWVLLSFMSGEIFMYNGMVFNKVMMLFLIIGIGALGRKFKIMEDSLIKGISELILYITLPLLILVSFQMDFSHEMLQNAGLILLISIFIHVFSAWIGKFIFPVRQENKKKILQFAIVFSNSSFMGFPVLESIFGGTGVFYASIYNVVFNVFLWTYGVAIFSNGNEAKMFKKVILNPGNLAVILGFILFIFSVKLPIALYDGFKLLGNTTVPLAMMIVGSRLADTKIRELFTDSSIYYITFIRLIGIPMLVYMILKAFPIDPIMHHVLVLLTAMPVAANTAIFAEKYGRNASFASACVFMSTALSILTLPFLHAFLNTLL
jgi:malate permease and related proteins